MSFWFFCSNMSKNLILVGIGESNPTESLFRSVQTLLNYTLNIAFRKFLNPFRPHELVKVSDVVERHPFFDLV